MHGYPKSKNPPPEDGWKLARALPGLPEYAEGRVKTLRVKIEGFGAFDPKSTADPPSVVLRKASPVDLKAKEAYKSGNEAYTKESPWRVVTEEEGKKAVRPKKVEGQDQILGTGGAGKKKDKNKLTPERR